MKKRTIALAIACAISLACTLAVADEFDWMPKGGCDLLQEAMASGQDGAAILQELQKKKKPEEWKAYFESSKNVFEKLHKKERDTLAAYLSINFPAGKIDLSKDPEKPDCADLPPDGKTLTLEKCSLCHPIAPIMTDERTVEGWRGAYDLPPMPQADLSEQEIETLIHYLAYNTPIPASSIPFAMRMPLPGY